MWKWVRRMERGRHRRSRHLGPPRGHPVPPGAPRHEARPYFRALGRRSSSYSDSCVRRARPTPAADKSRHRECRARFDDAGPQTGEPFAPDDRSRNRMSDRKSDRVRGTLVDSACGLGFNKRSSAQADLVSKISVRSLPHNCLTFGPANGGYSCAVASRNVQLRSWQTTTTPRRRLPPQQGEGFEALRLDFDHDHAKLLYKRAMICQVARDEHRSGTNGPLAPGRLRRYDVSRGSLDARSQRQWAQAADERVPQTSSSL